MYHETNAKWLERECAKTATFTGLASLAITELFKFPDGAEVVCGPISTGGRGNVTENFRIFAGTINALLKARRPIFSQMPYETQIFLFRQRWREENPHLADTYYMPILEEFYLPLFETGLIKKGWFIPGWESSFGARWEREQLARIGAVIEDLGDDWVNKLLAEK